MSALVEISGLGVNYGAARAIEELDLSIPEHTIVAVVGPNGAGKSSLARAVSGLIKPVAGRITVGDKDITGRRPEAIRRAGIVHLPEGRGVFTGLTVRENLRMATRALPRAERAEAVEVAYEHFPVLAERRAQQAGTLSGGEQQMLSLARGLVCRPRLLIADELSLGLAPKMVDVVFESLVRIRDLGVTLMVTEQYVHRVLSIADSAVILGRGRVRWAGPADQAQEQVASGYLDDAT